jgi:tRNA threonylcarbamoyladenosine biosynthesis protein TsaB
MYVIGLDTTTRAGSVALVDERAIVEERAGDAARSHAERLPRDVVDLIRDHGLSVSDIDLFGVASGPGSFTGLRIGIATVQGLAFVRRRRVLGVSALEALAHAGSRELRAGAVVAAWMDAHRREVFAALYRVAPAAPFTAARLEEMEGPTVGDPAATLARWSNGHGSAPAVFVGDGAILYQDVIRQRAIDPEIVSAPMLAGTIGRLAAARAGEAGEPSDIRPLYVRRPDAEIARDSR